VTIALILGFLASALIAESPPVEEKWEKNSHQWFETVDPEGRVLVSNPYGDVYARFGGYENQVEILATIQRLEHDLPELTVQRRPAGAGLDVIVEPSPAAPEGSGKAPPPMAPAERRDRVDLVLFVPLGVKLEISTEEDKIDVKGLKSDLIARSLSGDVRIRSVQGHVGAKSIRGDLSVALETGVTGADQELSTETGEIEVYLWEDANARVSIATSGEISTDFSIEIEHRRFEEPGKRAVAVVGKDGPGLSLFSKRGRVRLLRLPRHFKPDTE
jgi:hypothetical protein